MIAEVPGPEPGRSRARWSGSRRSRCCTRPRTGRRPFTATAASGGRCTISCIVDLTAFPDATSLASLREVGVTYVVVHTDDMAVAGATVEEQIAQTPALKLEHVEGTGRVYSTRCRP